MRKMTNWLAALGTVAAVALSPASAIAATADSPAPAKSSPKITDLFPDVVVAKGKGVEVKRSQLDDAMISIKSSIAARGQDLPPDEMNRLEQQILDRLIKIQILLLKATDGDKAAGKESCVKRMENIKARAGSEEVLTRQLKSVGTTEAELQAKMTEEITAQTVLERELKFKVSDEDVKKYYDDNPSKFEQPEMVRASHILLSTRDQDTNKDLSEEQKAAKHKKAEDVLKRARAGEDFAKLAKEFSEDAGSKDKGGEYQFSRGQMVNEFETAAFSLKTNEISDIVTTQYGYHIIKLSEKIPAKKVELAKVAPDLKDYLLQQQMQKHQQEVKEFLEKLKKDAAVEILDDSLKPKDNAESRTPQIIAPTGSAPKSDSK